MDKDAIMIVRGFLKLPNLEKKRVVDEINHYFDEIKEREAIRKDIEAQFANLRVVENRIECKCCGRE